MISKYFMMSWIHAVKKMLLKDININWPWAEADNRWFVESAIANVRINLFRHQAFVIDPKSEYHTTHKLKWEHVQREKHIHQYINIDFLLVFVFFSFFIQKYVFHLYDLTKAEWNLFLDLWKQRLVQRWNVLKEKENHIHKYIADLQYIDTVFIISWRWSYNKIRISGPKLNYINNLISERRCWCCSNRW